MRVNGGMKGESFFEESDFNKGQSDIASGIPDDFNGRFAVLGWTKSFFTYGETTKVITWYEGEIDNRTIEEYDECDGGR